MGLRNDLGLLSEEYDPDAGRLVGNFPQAFSHVSLVNSASKMGGQPEAHRRATSSPAWPGVPLTEGKGRTRPRHMGGFDARTMLSRLVQSTDTDLSGRATHVVQEAIGAKPPGLGRSSRHADAHAERTPTAEVGGVAAPRQPKKSATTKKAGTRKARNENSRRKETRRRSQEGNQEGRGQAGRGEEGGGHEDGHDSQEDGPDSPKRTATKTAAPVKKAAQRSAGRPPSRSGSPMPACLVVPITRQRGRHERGPSPPAGRRGSGPLPTPSIRTIPGSRAQGSPLPTA